MRFASFVHIVDGEVREIAYDDVTTGSADFGVLTINLSSKEIAFDERSGYQHDDYYLRFQGEIGPHGWKRASDNISDASTAEFLDAKEGIPYVVANDHNEEVLALNGTPSLSMMYYRGQISNADEAVILIVTSAPIQWEILKGSFKIPWPYGTNRDSAIRYDHLTKKVILDSKCLRNREFSFPGLFDHLDREYIEHASSSLSFVPFDGQLFRIGRELYLYVGGRMYRRVMVGVTLEAHNLRCEGFHNRTGQKKAFLKNASLTIYPGEIVAIIGESGGGKSTLLKALCGYCKANSGTVSLNGEDLYKDEQLRSSLCYLPQSDLLNESLTVHSELAYQARLKCPKEYNAERRAIRIKELLTRFNIKDEEFNRIGPLSGGQKKRVAIAAALLSEPSVLFLDEPTSPLDPGMSGEFVRDTLVEVSRCGCSVVFVTHDMDTLATADRVVWVHKNHIEWDGTLIGLMGETGSKDLTELAQNLFGRQDKSPTHHYESHTLNAMDVRSDIGMSSYLKRRMGKLAQFVLCAQRSTELLLSNPSSILMLAMPIVIGLLMGIVSDGDRMYQEYTFTKSMLFTFSAGAFFVGVFDSIQVFSKREHLAVEQYHGLSTTAYLLATILVQTMVCVLQIALLTGMFVGFSPTLDKQIISTIWDLYFTAFLCCESAMCMGLVASAMVERATNLAPVLVLLQIIFSGIIFPMEGISEKLSYFISCRWAVSSLGALSDLNALGWKVATEEAAALASQAGSDLQMYSVIHNEPIYNPEVEVFLRGWIWMAAISLLLVIAALVVLKSREHSQYDIVKAMDPILASIRRFVKSYGRYVIPTLCIIMLVSLILGGIPIRIIDMLKELGDYLKDVYAKLPTATSSAIEDFCEVFLGS